MFKESYESVFERWIENAYWNYFTGEDIVQKLYALYLENKLLDNQNIEITGKDACVVGLCKINKKNNLISINFHYYNIKWNSGIVEVWQAKKKF